MDGDDELFPPEVREARRLWQEAVARQDAATKVMLDMHREWVDAFESGRLDDEYRLFCQYETATSYKLAADREARLRGVAYVRSADA